MKTISSERTLTRWNFYAACFRYATSGAWGMIGNVSTVAGLLPGAAQWAWPDGYVLVARWLATRQMGDDLLWKSPVTFGLAVLIIRLCFIAPYKLYREKPGAAPVVRPRVHVRLDWSGGLGDCYEPFAVHNDSDVAAQSVEMSIASEGSLHARFAPISHLAGHEEKKIWPKIDGVNSRDGHPDLSKFMWTTMLESYHPSDDEGSELRERPFKNGIALPLEITYSDLDGNLWTTRAHLMQGGKWGAGRIVIETVGFG